MSIQNITAQLIDKIISTTASTVKEGEQIVAQKILDKISHEK